MNLEPLTYVKHSRLVLCTSTAMEKPSCGQAKHSITPVPNEEEQGIATYKANSAQKDCSRLAGRQRLIVSNWTIESSGVSFRPNSFRPNSFRCTLTR